MLKFWDRVVKDECTCESGDCHLHGVGDCHDCGKEIKKNGWRTYNLVFKSKQAQMICKSCYIRRKREIELDFKRIAKNS